ncbi:MAG: glycosyltransferase family 2 protein [Lachnospiraceae bacterium]|nr:glycosyltransferase family 2 protein [Lachnospiraceae bacterium]
MNIGPLISIIVPVYNTAPYLERCLLSLLAQTYHNIEIILVNDGSTDESGIICDRYRDKDRRVKSVHQENGGPMLACRKGISLSKGGYFCFMDSDDEVEAEMIQEMVKQLKFVSEEIICCNIIVERAFGISYEKHGLPPGEYEGEKHSKIFQNILGNENRQIILSRCMKLISRSLIINNLQYCDDDLRMGEDSVMILPALFDSKRIVIMEGAFYYHYYYNNESLVHGYMPDLYQQICRFYQITCQIMEQKVKQHGYKISNEEIKVQCKREHLINLMVVLKNEARGNHNSKKYRQRIKEICRKEKTRDLIRQYPPKVTGLANRLLYLVLKYPNYFSILLLRIAAKLFYGTRVKNSKGRN